MDSEAVGVSRVFLERGRETDGRGEKDGGNARY